MVDLTKEAAASFLSPVPEQNKFWCQNGEVYSTMKELSEALAAMPDEAFLAHVTKEKNDFSNWIYDIVGDAKLASALRKCKAKKTVGKKLQERIAELEQLLQ